MSKEPKASEFVAADSPKIAPESSAQAPRKAPPKAKIMTVMDDYHGRQIADPYRWLEDSAAPETQQFVAAQNAYTHSVLENIPGRDELRRGVEQLFTIGRVASPRIGGNNYFYERRDGRQNQAVVYVREGCHGNDRALIDVNALAPDGTIALDWWYPSEDGKYVAFGTSPNGSELSTLQVIESATGKLLEEKIERTRAASLAWLPDNSGFYYTHYPRPGDVPAGEEMYNRRVFFHQLGSAGNANGAQDSLIFPADGVELAPQQWPNVSISNDGRWLLVDVSEGWAKTELYLKGLYLEDLSATDLSSTDAAMPQGRFQRITTGGNFLYHGEILDGQLYITSNEGAPRFRVFKAACAAPERANWKEIIPESDAVIEGRAAIIARKLFVHSIKNASSQLHLFNLDGKPLANVAMPALGSIFDLGGNWNSESGFFGFVSYAVPPTVFEVSLSGQTTEWARVESGIDPARYEVEQLWFNSKDGMRVPMFVVSKKGLVRNGRNPTLLSGYGGFNVGRTPFFNRNVMLLLLESGGVYVDVQLRGGNEFGEDWHRNGMLEKKQNVFDDFIAAAEHLIAENYTDAGHLAIQGGSNGGLLMGAALTQRPDLFRAVVRQVPLLDMLRYQKFQIAKLWIPEYGSSDDPAQFEYLRAYSPYHHVKAGTQYPAVLFMTAESDTRVDPMHAVKMATLLQVEAANGPERPILLRVDAKAGHGVGKPIAKLVDDAVDVWS
ncbi:MAG TPA: prolyl oligopeptidase family serine peptidase, partial [Blattabacteriaceae bacterium]|nr:prolyl oligopeptidase family serine peptidase [Blattabacteriaceae bacterium]